MIRQPGHIDIKMAQSAIEARKRKEKPIRLAEARHEVFCECLCAKSIHMGPHPEAAPAIARLHDFIRSKGYPSSGKHYEDSLERSPPRCAREDAHHPAPADQRGLTGGMQ